MSRLSILSAIGVALAISADAAVAGGIVIIANANITQVDPVTLQKIYTGRVVELNGVAVTAVNAGNLTLRGRFLESFMHEDENAYVAYWIKRKYAGLGAPPRELANGNAVINYVRTTPGAIGYVDESELEPGINVLMR